MKLKYDVFKGILKSGNNFNKLEPGNTIIIPYNGIDTEFVVLGKNINPNPDEDVDYEFIDIMSKELLIPVGTKWKKFEPGASNEYLTYIKSDIIKELHSKLELFPKEIQNKVISKKERFLTGVDVLNNKNIYTTLDIGKVWIPSLKETTNECEFIGDSDPEAKQYPYFEDPTNRKFGKGHWWWTCSCMAFCNSIACHILSHGNFRFNYADNIECGSPLCLRIKL